MVSEVNNGYQGHILKIMIIIYNNGYQGNILKIVSIIYFEMNVLFTKICVLYIYIYIFQNMEMLFISRITMYIVTKILSALRFIGFSILKNSFYKHGTHNV